METPKDFLMRVCKNDGTSNVNYRYVEYSNITHSLNFEKALNMLKSDIEEMKKFLSAYGINDEEKAIQATYDIWLKHLVIR